MAVELKPEEISAILKKQLEDFDVASDIYESGTVLSVGDGIARIHGLKSAMSGELIEFPGGIRGIVLNLDDEGPPRAGTDAEDANFKEF